MKREDVIHLNRTLLPFVLQKSYFDTLTELLAYSVYEHSHNNTLEDLRDKDKMQWALSFSDNKKLDDLDEIPGALEELKNELKVIEEQYFTIAGYNKHIVTPYTTYVEESFKNNEPSDTDGVIAKYSYLFDFITNYITSVDESIDITENIPRMPGIHFQIQEEIPISSPTKEIIVRRSGDSRAIAALVKHLGALISLPIELMEMESIKGNVYVNTVSLDGEERFFDCASFMLGSNREECFLSPYDSLKLHGIFKPQEDDVFGKTSSNKEFFESSYYDRDKLNIVLEDLDLLYEETIGKSFDTNKTLEKAREKKIL